MVLVSLVQAVKSSLAANFNLLVEGGDIRFTQAPSGKGDLALSCGMLAKKCGVEPSLIATSLAESLGGHAAVATVGREGPYLNLYLHANVLFSAACVSIAEKRRQICTAKVERIMVEYLSPNTNKPLHLGHVRNGVLGVAVARLLKAAGHHVQTANLINDRGIHICKSMLGYRLFGENQTPESTGIKGDHFVGKWYVRFEQALKDDPTLVVQAEEMLRKWEAGDQETLLLWRVMNAWVYDGFNETEVHYDFSFDQVYHESELYHLGKFFVAEGLARNIFVKGHDGAILYVLPEGFGKNEAGKARVAKVLNPDGTSIYMTQDIGIAAHKVQQNALDRSLYVVASEQDNHFKVLFEILGALGFSWAKRCFHLSYGMVKLPHGRMKSREGVVVDADDLLSGMAALAAGTIQERQPELASEEVATRAKTIALAAIKFYLLSFRSQSSISFNPEGSLSFEGDTGPYCLYTYARIQSILAKAEAQGLAHGTLQDNVSCALGSEQERVLGLELMMFPSTVARAAEQYAPSFVTERVLAVAKAFNRLYRTHPILGSDQQSSERLALARATAETLRWGLSLLGIETLERM